MISLLYACKQLKDLNLFLLVFILHFITGCISVSPDGQLISPKEDSIDYDLIPDVPREFRAAWIASVANIDWPSKPGLSTGEQKAELRLMLDRMVAMNMNAVILQVRPSADALYLSALEPWSEFLTGEMGKAPSPFYDPLDFAIEEAHRRGLELHAWFNPFRALHPSSKSEVSTDHISRQHPEAVVEYGRHLWLNPGSQVAQDHTIRVIIDVVQRYNIDGVHIDDYFYPYTERDSAGNIIEFPDDETWIKYGGGLNREDWRRNNVDRFVERLYTRIKRIDPHVRFGISPFGIWRPGYPVEIEGFDAFSEIFADSRKWLNNGWLDYFSPQLYWAIDQPGQSYPILLNWWDLQNAHNRHLWPGNFTSRVDSGAEVTWRATEIINQVESTRQNPNASGNIHFSINPLMQNRDQLASRLIDESYKYQALVPASSWLGGIKPSKPTVYGGIFGGAFEVTTIPGCDEPVWLWVIQTFDGDNWDHKIIPGWKQIHKLRNIPELVVVTAVNRIGLESPSTIITSN